MPDRMDPDTRHAVTSAGGHARAAVLTPEQRTTSARTAATAAHRPAALAGRIVRAWAGLTDKERREVLAVLAPITKKRPAPTAPVEPGNGRRRAAVVA